MWEDEGDLSRRALVETYYSVKGVRLPWDQYKTAKYDDEVLSVIHELCEKHDVPFDLMSRLIISVDNTKFYTRTSVSAKEIEKILSQGWLHYDAINEGLKDEDSEN